MIVMRNDRFIVLCMLGVLAVVLAGCQSADSEVAQATARARRLYDRAQSLLNDTAYQVTDGGQFAPLAKIAPLPDPNAMAGPLVRGQINPMVDDALKEAIDGLEKALGAADQPEYDRIQAQALLARLYALSGHRHAFEAAENRRQADEAACSLERAAVNMSAHGKRIAYLDEMLKLSDQALTEIISEAGKEITALTEEISTANGGIGELTKKKDGLSKDNTDLLEKARKLETESLNVDAVKGVDIFDGAQDLRDKAGKNAALIGEMENSIAILKGKLEDLNAAKAAAETRRDSAQKMKDDRGKEMAARRTSRTAEVAKLTAVQQDAEKLAARCATAVKAASASDASTIAAYGKALEVYGKYRDATNKYKGAGAAPLLQPDPAVIAMMGDTYMALGETRTRMLLFQQRLAQAAAKTTELWTALPAQNTTPPVVGEIDDYVTNLKEAHTSVRQDFEWAEEAYADAGDLVRDDNRRWAYVLQQASAHVGIYRVTGDANAQTDALKHLDSLGQQEQSPNIYPTASDYRKTLKAPALLSAP